VKNGQKHFSGSLKQGAEYVSGPKEAFHDQRIFNVPIPDVRKYK